MPGYAFEFAAYLDSEKQDVTVLWIFNPPVLDDLESTYKPDGHVSGITSIVDTPPIFMVKSPKGACSIIIHLAVAESMLRRNILGLKLTRLPVHTRPR